MAGGVTTDSVSVWFRASICSSPSALIRSRFTHICVYMRLGSAVRYEAQFELGYYILPWSSFSWFGHSQWHLLRFYRGEGTVRVQSFVKECQNRSFIDLTSWPEEEEEEERLVKAGYPKIQYADVQYFSICINYGEGRGAVNLVRRCSSSEALFRLYDVQGCIQTFPDRVDSKIYAYVWYYSLRSNTKGYGGKNH